MTARATFRTAKGTEIRLYIRTETPNLADHNVMNPCWDLMAQLGNQRPVEVELIDLIVQAIVDKARDLAREIDALPEQDRLSCLNQVRRVLHASSPMRHEPVDLVEWVRSEEVEANDYNPNRVAPPEMRLLETSVTADGYTQPIVTYQNGAGYVVVDGFHRNRVGKESRTVRSRTKGYLPIVRVRPEQEGENERIASTIRHNRARGKHAVEPLTGIVSYLAKKGWDDAKIGRELGMDADEVLRFKQLTGLAELFADRDFSEAWEATDGEIP